MHVCRSGHLVEVETPAKVNLFLEVLGRRSDGYHELETLMWPVRLYDTLRVWTREDEQIVFTLRRSDEARFSQVSQASATIPSGDDNLVVRALRALRSSAGIERGVNVELVKRIPVAAGLAGGSSDAAAALVAGNLVWRLGFDRARLAAVAATIGSDVPFFLWSVPAVCRGRGERIEPIDAPATLPLVLVKPPAGLSTAAVFQACRPAEQPRSVEPLVSALAAGRNATVGRVLHNGLESAAATLEPSVARLRETFARLDLLGARMSGSGTTYFGIARHARQAWHVAARLRQQSLGAVFALGPHRGKGSEGVAGFSFGEAPIAH